MNQLNFEKQHQLQLTQSSTMQLDHQVMDCQLNLYLLQSNIVQTDTIVSNSVRLGFICQFSQSSSNLLRFFCSIIDFRHPIFYRVSKFSQMSSVRERCPTSFYAFPKPSPRQIQKHELLAFKRKINMIIRHKCWPISEEKMERLVFRQKQLDEGWITAVMSGKNQRAKYM